MPGEIQTANSEKSSICFDRAESVRANRARSWQYSGSFACGLYQLLGRSATWPAQRGAFTSLARSLSPRTESRHCLNVLALAFTFCSYCAAPLCRGIVTDVHYTSTQRLQRINGQAFVSYGNENGPTFSTSVVRRPFRYSWICIECLAS